MAQAYDIYLRDRLTEFELIIHNLPLRDGLVVSTKTYLDAMVSYLTLQKFIIGESDTVLAARIDDLLETVHEKFENAATLQFEAEASAEKPVAGSSSMILDTSNPEAYSTAFNTFSNFIELNTRALELEHSYSIGSGRNRMVLSQALTEMFETVFTRIVGAAVLDANADTSAEKFVEADMRATLDTTPFDIFYLLTVQCEAIMNLCCSADVDLWYSLGNANNAMVLTAHNGSVQSEKFCSIEAVQTLIAELNETLICFLESNGVHAQLDMDVNAGLERYRLWEDEDDSELEDIDDMDLEEFDYVVLA